MQKITILLFCHIAPFCLHGQNTSGILIPQLPQPPTTASMPRYNNSFQPQDNMAAETHWSQSVRPRQQILPFNSPNADKLKAEQDHREALYQALEKIDRTPVQRTVMESNLDTILGNAPVIGKPQYEATKQFWDALVILSDMKDGKRPFSITEAVYTVENAYYNNKLSKDKFAHAIESRAKLCEQIIKREGLNRDDNVTKNYAIQKLFQQDNIYNDTKTGKTIKISKLEYDFKDYMGDSSHAQMFVSKLIQTGKGQCHSMPLLYLAIAEQLKASAYLSLAPEHSFIRFSDGDGSFFNFETTNGYVVSDQWLLQTGYITTAAIKNKIYLDTLSQSQLLAMCMYDLAMGYIYDYGYDCFAEIALKQALPIDPKGIQGQIILGNIWAAKTGKAVRYYNIKTKNDFDKNTIATALQKRMFNSYNIIDGLGYQKMPKEAYAKWLNSVNNEKEKQDLRELQKQMQYIIKNSKVKLLSPDKKD
ncbi:hypothetical protein [Taibaiella chishuiensis]|uniref:Transglutaminase superfamily protein n=1 Tax=Taibaiella chishuiensis TaxID=1434707 RepID=A0A2P8D0X2_9BACT|nr:hypothetical protein [Taibaiella chishuiensis]PSK90869.1 hypothetical protein B0I18_107281 [Taibaiella chishuiensis]